MIVPMNKYAFLIHPADYDRFMGDLKQLGVLHIIEHDREPTAAMQEAMRKTKEIVRLTKAFESKKPEEETPANVFTDGEAILQAFQNASQVIEMEKQRIVQLQKELALLAPWGSFERDNLTRLHDMGLKTCFYSASTHRFREEWLDQYPLEIINETDDKRFFVIVAPAHLSIELPEADELRLPDKSIDDVNSQIAQAQATIDGKMAEQAQLANGGAAVLRQYAAGLQNEFATNHAQLHTLDEAEGNIRLIEGWVPTDADTRLQNLLDKSDILWLRGEKVTPDEKPPILLRNNWFSKLFEPIGKLYSLPGYGEMDLTPFFAPFFMMFFGFCFGDAGYGLLLVLAGLIVRPRLAAEYKPMATLMIFLSLAAVLFGSITGTFFGAKLTDFDALKNLKQYMLDDQQMFNLALGLGVVQIVFGMMVKVFNISRQNGFKYSFSTIGWILVIVSSIAMYALDMADAEKGWMLGRLHMIVLGVAGLGIFVFNDPRRNILINVGAGLWDSYNMVTGIAGDVLSYIRLFALGLSSGILGMVFNQLAFNLSPDVPVLGQIITALILIFGHSLNIFMAVLGSFVHPMRLTFVEFYKNAGFNGGGKAYSPFKKISQ
ncbi:V/A-type H+-transporting ATPase subunit I [Breznakibacter xylanolyticus]|uniref:V/A-type H+-transporting ATPase subunit I n=2 Tax=Breznakibacter xylanolyticus TaxID=990 RepID=A0A2W7N0I5_9BACT|nr:V/A-type H+-transporting ATPase subunit I [Breznakibacter xylanolyticus]